MRAALVIIFLIQLEKLPKVTFAKNDDMVKTILSDRADQPFSIRILPGRPRRYWPVSDTHRFHAQLEGDAVGTIEVAQNILWHRLPCVSFDELASNPLGSRVPGHPEPYDQASIVMQNQQTIQELERDRRYHEQVHRCDSIGMVGQEGLPTLRWWPSPQRHILRHTRLADIDSELEKLSMDSWCAPQRVGNAHLADQLAYLHRDLWPSTVTSRFPAPEAAKSGTAPPDHRFRPNDRQSIHHTGNEAIEGDKDRSVSAGQNKPLWRLAA